jgi:hypothetical protein
MLGPGKRYTESPPVPLITTFLRTLTYIQVYPKTMFRIMIRIRIWNADPDPGGVKSAKTERKNEAKRQKIHKKNAAIKIGTQFAHNPILFYITEWWRYLFSMGEHILYKGMDLSHGLLYRKV